MSKERYFNVPIQLLEGLLIDKNSILNNIIHYSVYEYCITKDVKIHEAEDFFSIKLGNVDFAYNSGEDLWNSLPFGLPMVGINVAKLFEFLKENKSDFDLVCFLAYHALRSIIQQKAYCKIDNLYLLSRMDGKAKKVSSSCELSQKIKKYHNEYQMVKIKRALSLTWGLSTYSRYTRGFYVSFQLPLEDLILYAEKQRKSYRVQQMKEENLNAYLRAIERLGKKRP